MPSAILQAGARPAGQWSVARVARVLAEGSSRSCWASGARVRHSVAVNTADDPSSVESHGAKDRAHVERFCPVLYLVVAPVISHITVHQLWGSRIEDAESGGASFAQRSIRPSVAITTGITALPGERVSSGTPEPAAVRPAGLVHDRLAEIRYPDDYASHARADWDRWSREVMQEAEEWAIDDARWAPSRITVDDGLYEGVHTEIDRSYAVGSFYLPEGRLDVGIERLGSSEEALGFEQLRIVRSTDLDQVDWDDEPEDDGADDSSAVGS